MSRLSELSRFAFAAVAAACVASGCAPPTDVLSETDVLRIKEEIRDATTNYVLYRDGDGVNPPDAKRFAQELFTADGILEGYAPGGQLIFRWRMNGETGEISVMEGLSREEIGKSSPAADGRPVAVFHYPVSVKFDKVTAQVVETRTTALVLTVTKNTQGPACTLCASQPVTALVSVYHDVWHLTANGWRKHISREYLLT